MISDKGDLEGLVSDKGYLEVLDVLVRLVDNLRQLTAVDRLLVHPHAYVAECNGK